MPSSKKCHVTFYGDKESTLNKLFDFKVNDKRDAIRCLQWFKNRYWSIRIAYYHEDGRQEIIEQRATNPVL